MVVDVQQEGILIEVRLCGIQARQVVWDEAKAFALPVCCVDHVSPSQENLGKGRLASELARKLVFGRHCRCRQGGNIVALADRPTEGQNLQDLAE